MSVQHYPKGSMCRSCKHRMRDCRGLAFEQMPPIVRTTENGQRVHYVKCYGWEGEK